jgi:hypothetical protein
MFPSPAASHDHTLGVVLLCRRVWPIHISWMPFSIIQCIAYVRNTYHPFLDQSPYTHAHTHLVPCLLPQKLHTSSSSSLSSCDWIKLCMYVCVRIVCVCRLRVHMTRLIRPHEPHEPAAGMHLYTYKAQLPTHTHTHTHFCTHRAWVLLQAIALAIGPSLSKRKNAWQANCIPQGCRFTVAHSTAISVSGSSLYLKHADLYV